MNHRPSYAEIKAFCFELYSTPVAERVTYERGDIPAVVEAAWHFPSAPMIALEYLGRPENKTALTPTLTIHGEHAALFHQTELEKQSHE